MRGKPWLKAWQVYESFWQDSDNRSAGYGPCTPTYPPGWGGDVTDSFLQQRMHDFAGDARSQYRTWIVVSWASCLSAVLLILIISVMFYWSVFRPLGVLIAGSRRVAGGDFDHRILLRTNDEVSDLALQCAE